VNVAFSAVDEDPSFERYVRAKFPLIDYRVGPSFEGDKRFDIVLASHVVEHTTDPSAFVAAANAAAKNFCLFYAPYNEQDLIAAHSSRIDDDLMRTFPRLLWSRIRSSMGWRPCDGAETVLFLTAANGNDEDWSLLIRELDASYQNRKGPVP
jgi:hypothetical protein